MRKSAQEVKGCGDGQTPCLTVVFCACPSTWLPRTPAVSAQPFLELKALLCLPSQLLWLRTVALWKPLTSQQAWLVYGAFLPWASANCLICLSPAGTAHKGLFPLCSHLGTGKTPVLVCFLLPALVCSLKSFLGLNPKSAPYQPLLTSKIRHLRQSSASAF